MQIECHGQLTDGLMAEWEEFLLHAERSHPRQSPRFAAVERALGHDVVHVIGRQDGRICAVGLFSLRRSRVIPGRFSRAVALSGPVCDDVDTLTAFLTAIARSGAFARVDALTITPYWSGDAARALAEALRHAGWGLLDPEPFRHTGMIDLTRSAEAIRASFSASARRKLRLVEASPISIRPVSDLEGARVFFDFREDC